MSYLLTKHHYHDVAELTNSYAFSECGYSWIKLNAVDEPPPDLPHCKTCARVIASRALREERDMAIIIRRKQKAIDRDMAKLERWNTACRR